MSSWIVLGLLAALGAAGVAVFGKLGLAKVDTTLATTARSLVMFAALAVFAVATGKGKLIWDGGSGLDKKAWLYVLLAGLCGAGSWLAYFAALKLGPAGPVSALDRLSLPIVFVLAAAFLGERAGWLGWIGLVVMLIGIFLIVTDTTQSMAGS